MLVKRKRIPLFSIITLGLLPSFLKIMFYRMRGAHIGKHVHISLGAVLIGKKINIGSGTSIGFATIIRGRKIRIGRNVEISSLVFIDVNQIDIDDDVLVREQVWVGGLNTPDSSIMIGKRSHIHQMCKINPAKPVKIGLDTAIGGHSLIFTHSSWQSILDGYPCTFEPVKIGDNVWISWDVFILPGVTIGDGSLITAGSIVTRNIPERCIASGNPARVVIPSGSFPREIDSSEKDSIVRKILDEFWRHLSHHDFHVQIETTTPHLIAKVKKKERTCFFRQKNLFNLIYIYGKVSKLEKLPINSSSICLSLNILEQSFRNKLSKSGCVWADLYSHQRGGTNDFGEELLRFLRHYGIRFENTDL